MGRARVIGCGAGLLVATVIFVMPMSAFGPQRAANSPQQLLNGRPALIDSVKDRDLAAVRALLAEHVDPNVPAADGSTALFWAAEAGEATIVDALVTAGANVNAANRYGVTPLALACEGGNAAVIGRLLTAGADPNSPLLGGQTALMTAARTGRPESVKLLIARGANVNAHEETRGQTALMWAAAEGHVAVIEELLQAGAELAAKSRGPIVQERASGNRVPIGGMRAGRERLDSFTPLLFAVQFGHLEAVKALVDHGANVNDTAPDGTSALVMAIANGHYEVGGYLLDKDA